MHREGGSVNDGIEFKGLDEFSSKLAQVRKYYPDAAEAELRKLGNMLKKKAIAKSPEGKAQDKHKIKKTFHLSQAKLAGKTIYIEFWSSSPHFHLIERGFTIVGKDGQEKGFKPGVYMVESAGNEVDEEIPKEVNSWLDKFTKENGL